MRLRSAGLAVVVCAAVAAPFPATAADEQCTLVMPTKVVIGAETVDTPVRLDANCTANGAARAYWDIETGGRALGTIRFHPEDFTDGVTSGDMVWFDVDPMGRYTSAAAGSATADAAPLSQNSPVTLVKYASRLLTTTTRARTGTLTWSVTAQQWSGRAHTYVVRPRVNVGLFHRVTTSAPWTYVKSATTTSTGRATLAMSKPRSGYYRVVVAETPTIWAAYSGSVPGAL